MNKVTEHPLKNRRGDELPLVVVTALFVTLYLISNIMAVKVIGLAELFYFDAGTITFPLTYMLGAVITEIWGYGIARRTILITFVCNLILVIFTQIGVYMPSPDYMTETANAYNHIFSYVPRIIVGSLVAFLLGELTNAKTMSLIKKLTKGKYLWLRTIGSSAIGYMLDSVAFVVIAFYGTISNEELLMMMLFQYIMKLSFEILLSTPLVYAVVSFLKRKYFKHI